MRSPAAGQPKEMRCAHMKWISKRTWMEYHTHNIGPMNQKESTCMHHWNPLRWCLLQHCYYARPSRLIRCRETSCVTNKVRAVPGKARSGFQGICILRASETFLWWFHEKTQSADASLAWPTCSPHPRARDQCGSAFWVVKWAWPRWKRDQITHAHAHPFIIGCCILWHVTHLDMHFFWGDGESATRHGGVTQGSSTLHALCASSATTQSIPYFTYKPAPILISRCDAIRSVVL